MVWSAIVGGVFVACVAFVVGEGLVGNPGFGAFLWLGGVGGVGILGCLVFALAILAGCPIFDGFSVRGCAEIPLSVELRCSWASLFGIVTGMVFWVIFAPYEQARLCFSRSGKSVCRYGKRPIREQRSSERTL